MKVEPATQKQGRIQAPLSHYYSPVSSSMKTQWLKEKVGRDIAIFKGYSLGGASSAAALSAKVTTGDIFNAANWRTCHPFSRGSSTKYLRSDIYLHTDM